MPKCLCRSWAGVSLSARPSSSLEVHFHEVQHTTMDIKCLRGNPSSASAIFKENIGFANVPPGPDSTAMSVGLHLHTSPSQAHASTGCSQHCIVDPGIFQALLFCWGFVLQPLSLVLGLASAGAPCAVGASRHMGPCPALPGLTAHPLAGLALVKVFSPARQLTDNLWDMQPCRRSEKVRC